MSEFKKALKIIGGENVEIKSGAENNINPLAIPNYYDVRKVDIDLNNGETTTFNPFDTDNVTKMMKNKEIKAIIHDFYKEEYKYFVSVGVDELLSDESKADDGYRFIMFQLQEELTYKDEYESLNELEIILQLILSNDSSKKHKHVYSDKLVNEFKNLLKEVGE